MTEPFETEVRARLVDSPGEPVHAVTLRGHVLRSGALHLHSVTTHCGIDSDRVPVLVEPEEPLTCDGCIAADGRDAADMAWALMVDARTRTPVTA